MPRPQEVTVFSCSDVPRKKLDDNIASYVLGDQTKEGATKQKVYKIPPKNMTITPTNSQGRDSALKSNTKNSTVSTQVLLTALGGFLGVPDIIEEEKERVLLKLGASIPFSILDSSGGEKDRHHRPVAGGDAAGIRAPPWRPFSL